MVKNAPQMVTIQTAVAKTAVAKTAAAKTAVAKTATPPATTEATSSANSGLSLMMAKKAGCAPMARPAPMDSILKVRHVMLLALPTRRILWAWLALSLSPANSRLSLTMAKKAGRAPMARPAPTDSPWLARHVMLLALPTLRILWVRLALYLHLLSPANTLPSLIMAFQAGNAPMARPVPMEKTQLA